MSRFGKRGDPNYIVHFKTSLCQTPVGRDVSSSDANEYQMLTGDKYRSSGPIVCIYVHSSPIEKECRISAKLSFALYIMRGYGTRASIVRDGSLCGLHPVSEIRATENTRTNWGYK